MRKLVHIAVAASGTVALAFMFFSPVAANASASAPTTQRAAATTPPASHHSPPACQKVHSAGHATLLRCSQLLGVAPAGAPPQSTAALSLSPQLMATSSDGCVGNGQGDSSCSYTVSPRVQCGGYNGHVWWDDANFGGTYIIGTYGEVWDTCGWTTYVYLSWEQNMGLRSGNDNAGHATDFTTVGVNYSDSRPAESVGGVSDVGIAVCSTYNNGWHCGSTQHV